MRRAKNGDTVKVHFTGKLQNGKVFDTSKGRQPLDFTIGSGNMMPGFEKGVTGMAVGETKTFTVLPEEAYGLRHEKLRINIKKCELPEHIAPVVGQQIEVKHPNGDLIQLIITEVNEDSVTLDANHPLAGKLLFFDVELVQIT